MLIQYYILTIPTLLSQQKIGRTNNRNNFLVSFKYNSMYAIEPEYLKLGHQKGNGIFTIKIAMLLYHVKKCHDKCLQDTPTHKTQISSRQQEKKQKNRINIKAVFYFELKEKLLYFVIQEIFSLTL